MTLADYAHRIADGCSHLFTRLLADGDATTPRPDFLRPSPDSDCLGTLGRFRVIEVIGRGGAGTVVLADDRSRGRRVALKVLDRGLASADSARRAFLREGRIARSIHHPNVLATHGVLEIGGTPVIVSDYMAGGSLQDRLDREGPMPASAVCYFGAQIALGLEAIHAKGLVHGDIKPSNVLLDRLGRALKISDFGLARVLGPSGKAKQRTVMATPQYASPEQLRGDPIDCRSDLFSLGGVLYAMCTGEPPFPGTSTPAIVRSVCRDRPDPISRKSPKTPSWLVAVIDKLLEKEPGDRFQTAHEVVIRLTGRGD